MLRQLLLSLLACASVFAFADDSSFPRIDVKGISPGPMKSGDKVAFYGKDAADFFNMLPSVKSVDPKQDKITRTKERSLTIVSGSYTLEFDCGTVHYDNNGNEIANVQGTVCTMTMGAAKDIEGDSFSYKPGAACQP